MAHRRSRSQPLSDEWFSWWSAGMTLYPSCDQHSTPPPTRSHFPLSPPRRRDVRGMSMSVLITMLLPVLLVSAGIAVDGAERARAVRIAHTVAAEAARAGCEEGSAAQLVGQDGTGAARVAAEDVRARGQSRQTEPTCHHRQWRRRQRCDRGHPAYSSTRPYRSNRSARSSEPNVYPAGPLRLLQRGCSDTIARCLSISRSTRRIHSGVPSTRSSTSCTVAVSSPTRRTQVMPSEPGLEIRMLWTGFANFVSYLTNITSH